MIRRLFSFLAMAVLACAQTTTALKQIKVTLDYLGESGTTLTMPIDASGNTDPEATVGLTVAGSREPIRFGDLFRNTRSDSFSDPLFLQLLRCAYVRLGGGQPNSAVFRANVNSVGSGTTGEAGIWMPKRTYYVGKIIRIGDESPTNPLWRVHYAETLTEANAPSSGSLTLDFTSLDVDVTNTPPTEILKDMIPGLILRRLSGTYANPPVAATLNTFRKQLNDMVIEY